MDDMSEYKKLYEAESAEHLQSMNDALLTLEKEPENSETINVMFRAAHTLKGMSATMGYSKIAELTHKMENLMDSVRRSEVKLDTDAIDILFDCLDALEKMIENPEKSSQFDISTLLQNISSISRKKEGAKPAGEVPPAKSSTPEVKDPGIAVAAAPACTGAKSEKGFNIFSVTTTLHESCLLKSARCTVVMRNLSEVGEILSTSPPVKDIEDERFDREFTVTVSTQEDARKLEDAVKKVLEISKVEVKPADFDTYPQVKTKITEKIGILEDKHAVKSVQSVRVSIERLDLLMNLVGELVINKIRLTQLARENKFDVLEETLANLNRLTNDLQEKIIQSRMVPIDQIFNRFPRMIRDLAKKEGKEIELVLEGSEIELDRTVLDEVGDPLVHILRNCIDHGIESPDVRKQQGKNPKGRITLTARREKNHVVIEVEDDGKGMDPMKFREDAVKKGILTKEEVARLSDTEVINLSFLPGFSTAERVTDVSGRGVGMDVVKTKIEGIGGSARLESQPGKGIKITLKLPLTVAIIQSLMVEVDKAIYAIPITNVVRSLTILTDQIKTIKGEEVILIRGEVLPIARLHKLFGINSNGSNGLVIVVVERGGNNIGLVVDRLIGQQEVIIKNLDSHILKGVKGFAGATILGDGNVALIIDVGTLI